jgi:hypothetical protein
METDVMLEFELFFSQKVLKESELEEHGRKSVRLRCTA